MKNILTENRNDASSDIDLANTKEIVKIINDEDKKVALAIEKATPDIVKAVNLIVKSLKKGGRLAYFGAGTSGRLGVLDASEWWPTFSVNEGVVNAYIAGGDFALKNSVEGAEDDEKEALKHLKEFNPSKNDVVVGISASGNPKYVLKVLSESQKAGAKTIGLTSNPEAKLKKYADVCITTVVGSEVISGSSRMKSGTAQKMVLNMLSTASMIKLGKTYSNYMIDVQPVCSKLIDRANRIISSVCEISIAKADEYRIKADNNVKIACIMCKKYCSKEEARQLLDEHDGVLRKVI